MGPMDVSWEEFEKGRRRLNAKLGTYLLAMTPIPLVLLAMDVSPLWMLLLVICAAVGIGVVYPLWWRGHYNPDRHEAQEKWTVLVVSVCRCVAVFSAVASAVSWATMENKGDGIAGSIWVVAFSVVAVVCFLFSFHAQDKTRRALGQSHG
jgi:uncharacterized membrane protein